MIMHCDQLNAVPINLGSSEMVSINELVSVAEEIGGVKLKRTLRPERPQGGQRPQQRQHHDPANPRLAAQHPAAQGPGQDLRLDQRAIRRPQGRASER
jgi:hypothetical protein